MRNNSSDRPRMLQSGSDQDFLGPALQFDIFCPICFLPRFDPQYISYTPNFILLFTLLENPICNTHAHLFLYFQMYNFTFILQVPISHHGFIAVCPSPIITNTFTCSPPSLFTVSSPCTGRAYHHPWPPRPSPAGPAHPTGCASWILTTKHREGMSHLFYKLGGYKASYK